MARLLFLICLFSSALLSAYTPESELQGKVKSVRTYKEMLRPIPAGEYEEPWLINADFNSRGQILRAWYYHMGQEIRRHEFRYSQDGEGRERTTWVTFFLTPDLRPPAERLAGYEHWYTLKMGDNPSLVETHFETVQNHPVKSVFRYYDGQDRLIRETDTLSDLDTELIYDSQGRIIEKRGYRGEDTFWREQYFYDDQDRLVQVLQSDLNRELYQREDYLYEPLKITFNKYLLTYPIERESIDLAPLNHPWYQTVKFYDSNENLIKLENYRWNGPFGMMLTEEKLYTHDSQGYLVMVEEVNRKQRWQMTYDGEGNWINLTFQDQLNRTSQEILKWYRVIEYYK